MISHLRAINLSVRLMRQLGYSKAEIAQKLGVAASTVRHWARHKLSFHQAYNSPKRTKVTRRIGQRALYNRFKQGRVVALERIERHHKHVAREA